MSRDRLRGRVARAHRAPLKRRSAPLAQLKILQEVITLTVFVPFALFYMHEKLSWNYLCAGVCLLGAVFFIFR